MYTGPLVTNSNHYCLTATGPLRNAFRLLRAMQLGRPLMLEGDPGVGKTSIVSALAAAGGHSLTRINLSEHTVSLCILCILCIMIIVYLHVLYVSYMYTCISLY